MTNERMQELIDLGFDEKWLKDVKENFKPKTEGKYRIRIFDCEDLDQEPDTGIFVSACLFTNEYDLSVIHHFFEGMFYIMEVVETGEELGRGIIDGAPFDEMEEYEGKSWNLLMGKELGPKFVKREKERGEEIVEYNNRLKEKEEFLSNLVDVRIDEIFLEYQEENGIESGDISPEDALDLDHLKDKLKQLIIKVCG